MYVHMLNAVLRKRIAAGAECIPFSDGQSLLLAGMSSSNGLELLAKVAEKRISLTSEENYVLDAIQRKTAGVSMKETPNENFGWLAGLDEGEMFRDLLGSG